MKESPIDTYRLCEQVMTQYTAKEYQKYYFSVLYPDGDDPIVVKGKYDDLIRKIFPVKSGS